VQDNYPPGSIFKVVVALAALDAGLNPAELYHVEPNPANPGKGMIRVGGQTFRDTAPPGDYDFRKAFIHSSNAYFITNGIRAGIRNIVRLGQQLHLGERATAIPARQEVSGYFPELKRVGVGWSDAATANVCIGQSPVLVTPLQMAVMTGAIANGGKVLWPRIVDRIEPQDPLLGEPQEYALPGQVRAELDVKPRSLQLVREAMLADTEDPGGTAYQAFHGAAAGPKALRVCGKTGTAQIEDARGTVVDHITWFISFAPYDKPRYVVVVMVESGGSGGTTCAPIAREIYAALERQEQNIATKNNLAQIQ
jgi:penicillin-binding protein 2